jgi:hypothetical protein
MMTQPLLRALETRYAGCRFRSRLEARWAVFFDHLGIEWEHEPEGYATGAGPYLPDFKITISRPTGRYSALFEVKPERAGADDRHLALAQSHRLIVARGLPRDHASQGHYLADMHRWLWDGGPAATPGFFICATDGILMVDWPGWSRYQHPIDAAYVAARSARFDGQGRA